MSVSFRSRIGNKTNISLLFFILMSVSILPTKAQTILLSNHTFSEERKEVGAIQLSTGPIKEKILLKGTDAKAFTIQNGKLYLKDDASKLSEAWYDVALETQVNGRTITENFRIVNDKFNKNKVIAHRGAWKNTGASENSISALKHAINLNCEGSEFDVHMSADSVLFVNHDPDIQGLTIEKSTAAQLATIKLPNGEFLPTLEAYLQEGIKQTGTKLILEIKPSRINKAHAVAAAAKIVDMVKRLKAQAWIDYISFDYEVCRELIRLDPYARVAYLNGDRAPQELAADKLWGLDYHYSVLKKNESWIQEALDRKLTVNAWTVNDLETMKWLLDKSASFITTNEPELLLKLVREQL